MADWAKIAVKVGLIAVFTVAIFALFVVIPFPSVSLTTDMINGIAFAKSYLIYWVPNFNAIFGFTLAVVAFELGLILVKFSLQAARWLMKVNE